MRYVLAVSTVAAVALFTFVGASLADPNLPTVVAHQHFVITADGDWISVGPQVCPAASSPQLQRAFNQFHFNIHHSELPGPSGGPVETLGPQDGAPGLHNGIAADMVGRPCSFVPPSS